MCDHYGIECFWIPDLTGDISGWNVANVKDMSGMFWDTLLEGREPAWWQE